MWARAQKGQLGCVCVAAVPTRRWQGPEKEHLLLTSPHLLSLYNTAKVFPVEPEGAGPQLLDWKEDLRLGAEAKERVLQLRSPFLKNRTVPAFSWEWKLKEKEWSSSIRPLN